VVVFSPFPTWRRLGRPWSQLRAGDMNPYTDRDIIFIQSIERTDIVTHVDGEQIAYTSFEITGMLYFTNQYGRVGVTPIIHRAMYYVEKGSPCGTEAASPHAVIITKGDNPKTNPSYDQQEV